MIQAAIAALALPVSGFVIGKVVGDYYLVSPPLLAWMGILVGLGVYAFTLVASYRHLKAYFRRFESRQDIRGASALAVAVEVATFYMAVSAVVMGSQWAFWGGIVGAWVVFFGNYTSMSRGARGHPPKARRKVQAKAGQGQARKRRERNAMRRGTARLP